MNIIKKKKMTYVQVIRHMIQLAAFILFPGLFISAFSAVREVYTAIITGNFGLTTLAEPLLLLLAIFPITILWGRFFCGYLCAFGSMGDLLWALSGKLFKKRRKVSAQTDRLLKYVKYVILLLIVILFWTLAVPIDSTMNPWTIFGMYASISGWSSLKYLFTVGGALLLLIMIGSMLIERFFCRYFCPLGAIFALVSRFRRFRIKKPRENCGSCRLCTWKCSMGIDLTQCDAVDSGECIDCFACVDVCPRHNAKAAPAPAVAATMSVAAMTGLYYAGSLLSKDLTGSMATPSVIVDTSSAGQYQDGTYTGTGTGFKGDTTVQVTVKNGNISDITVLSTNDDQEFFSRAKNTIINEILSQQSTQVDTVTGATFSSNGIIAAVADALSTAGGTADVSQENTQNTGAASAAGSSSNGSDSSGSSDSSAAQEISSLADGVYSGSGTGFRGTTTVSVTVAGGQITDITVDSYADDEQFFDRAKSGVIANILSQQSVNVDTVTGATFSSNGIIEAVADALGLSYENANSLVSEQGHGGGHGGPQNDR